MVAPRGPNSKLRPVLLRPEMWVQNLFSVPNSVMYQWTKNFPRKSPFFSRLRLIMHFLQKILNCSGEVKFGCRKLYNTILKRYGSPVFVYSKIRGLLCAPGAQEPPTWDPDERKNFLSENCPRMVKG